MELYATKRGILDAQRELNALEARISRIARQRSDLSIQLGELNRDRQRLQRHLSLMVREMDGRDEFGGLASLREEQTNNEGDSNE